MKELYMNTAIGWLRIQSDGTGICAIQFVAEAKDNQEDELCLQCAKELQEYFAGKRKTFSVLLNPKGTPFQVRVWDALCKIPYGETRSYKEVAIMVGNDKASRAVGMANNKNPIAIIVPCHRVIGTKGKLVGYAGGLDKKETLLAIEKNNI